MIAKTLVVVDYDTQKTPSIIEQLTNNYDVLFVAFNRLPDLPVPTRQILSAIFLCTKPDTLLLHQIAMLQNVRPDLPIVVMSPQPTPDDVANALHSGARHYLNLAADGDLLAQWLYREAEKRQSTKLTFWDYLPAWLSQFQPKTAKNSLILVQNSLIPLPSLLFEEPTTTEAPPQYSEDFLDIQLFGEFILKHKGRILKPKKNAALLAYLLYNHEKPMHRDHLIAKFWGDSTHESARNCLNAAIFSIRKTLNELTDGRRILVYESDFYAIDTATWHVETDADRFNRHWEKARLLLRTQGLMATTNELQTLRTIYNGSFLDSVSLDWFVGKRDEFGEKHLQALNWLAEALWQQHNYVDCIELCNEILAIDDCVEVTHQRLIQCYNSLKMTEKAVRQFQKCSESLRRIHAQPSAETTKLCTEILLPSSSR